MLRFAWSLLAAAMLISHARPLHAEWLSDFWASFKQDTVRNNVWPEPFGGFERQDAIQPFELMTSNGWRRQNLLGDHHFLPDSSRLTKAGELKVEWILTQAPPERRTIFVERGENRHETLSRVESARQWAERYVDAGQLANVEETHLIAEGRPADDVDATNVRFRETARAPQLPDAAASGEQ